MVRLLALAYLVMWERAEARPLAFWSVLTIVLLSAGGLVGFVAGYWMAPEQEKSAAAPLEPVFPDPVANGNAPLELSRPPPDEPDEGGYELPVRVEKPPLPDESDAAPLYEEPLEQQPADIRPDPDSAIGTLGHDPAAPGALEGESPLTARGGGQLPDASIANRDVSGSEDNVRDLASTRHGDIVPERDSLPNGALQREDFQWQRNAVDFQPIPGVPMIAIVIDDLGVNLAHSRKALTLPAPMTFAFLPYGFDLDTLVADARENGHEILVHLPMEPLSLDADPGPQALLTGLSKEELDQRIAWNLSQIDSYIGVNNHMGSLFTANEPAMRQVLEEVKSRGLIYLDSLTTRETQGYRLAREMKVPHVLRDIFLDHDQSVSAIRKQLEKVEAKASARGWAVAIGHPHDETRRALQEWIEELDTSRAQLVPLSTILKEQEGK